MRGIRKALLLAAAKAAMAVAAIAWGVGLVGGAQALPVEHGFGELLATTTSPAQYGTDGADLHAFLIGGGDPRFADLEPADVQLADKWVVEDDSYVTGRMVFTPTVFKDDDPDEPIFGAWQYLGFPEAEGPGESTIDLFLIVKYGFASSIFYYGSVNPLDTGTFSSDPGLIPGVDACSQSLTLPDCMQLNPPGNAPLAISNVQGFWPPVDGQQVPEPATLGLFGAGLLGLAVLRRRRRAA